MQGWLARFINKPVSLRARDVKAARAVYHDSEIQRMEIVLNCDEGRLVIEMTADTSAKLISQLQVAYTAMRPPLRGPGAAGHYGMGE